MALRLPLLSGEPPSDGRSRVHRIELRPLLGRTSSDGPGDRLRRTDLRGHRPNLADVEDRIGFVHGDVCDAELVLRTLRNEEIDTVVHFAAESHNSLAVLDPARFFRTNVLGTQTMLDASRHAGVSRFHHISTCEVYGDLPLDSVEAFNEESPYRPRTPYNASKAGADHAVRARTGRRSGCRFP